MRNGEKGVQIFKYFMLHSKSAFIRKRILFGSPRACAFLDIELCDKLRAYGSRRQNFKGNSAPCSRFA